MLVRGSRSIWQVVEIYLSMKCICDRCYTLSNAQNAWVVKYILFVCISMHGNEDIQGDQERLTPMKYTMPRKPYLVQMVLGTTNPHNGMLWLVEQPLLKAM